MHGKINSTMLKLGFNQIYIDIIHMPMLNQEIQFSHPCVLCLFLMVLRVSLWSMIVAFVWSYLLAFCLALYYFFTTSLIN